MNGLVKLLVRVGIMVGVTKGVEYFATRSTDTETPEGKAAAKLGRQEAKQARKKLRILQRFTRF